MLPCYFHSSGSLGPRENVWVPKSMLEIKAAGEKGCVCVT